MIDVWWSSEPSLEPADRQLVLAAGHDAGPFAHPAVFDAWLATFGQRQPVLIGRARKGRELVGLLVLTERCDDPGRWRLWGSSVDIGTVIVAAGAEQACWSRWLEGAELQRPFVLRNLPNAHRVTEGLVRACRGARRAVDIVDRRAMPHVDLRDGVEAWLAGRSVSQRRQFRRSRTRFTAIPDIAIAEHCGPGVVSDALDHFFDLHARRFAALERTSVYDDPDQRAFLRAMAEGLADAGRFRVFLATSAGTPVGIGLVVTTSSTWSRFNGGWDPAYRDHFVGTAMLVHEIEAAAAAGAGRYSLLEGEEHYKYQYATGEATLVSWTVDVRREGHAA